MFEIMFGIVGGIVLLRMLQGGHLPKHLKFKRGWISKDDTDNRETGDVSGLNLFVDYGTGLHYIQGGMFGGIIPRLDKDGNHMCEPSSPSESL